MLQPMCRYRVLNSFESHACNLRPALWFHRFALLWSPCIEALAAALEHCSHQAWPLVLEQLTTAQASFLAGSSATAGGRLGSRPREVAEAPQDPQLLEELTKAMHSGDADENGGCTDAAVRLGNLLKVG